MATVGFLLALLVLVVRQPPGIRAESGPAPILTVTPRAQRNLDVWSQYDDDHPSQSMPELSNNVTDLGLQDSASAADTSSPTIDSSLTLFLPFIDQIRKKMENAHDADLLVNTANWVQLMADTRLRPSNPDYVADILQWARIAVRLSYRPEPRAHLLLRVMVQYGISNLLLRIRDRRVPVDTFLARVLHQLLEIVRPDHIRDALCELAQRIQSPTAILCRNRLRENLLVCAARVVPDHDLLLQVLTDQTPYHVQIDSMSSVFEHLHDPGRWAALFHKAIVHLLHATDFQMDKLLDMIGLRDRPIHRLQAANAIRIHQLFYERPDIQWECWTLLLSSMRQTTTDSDSVRSPSQIVDLLCDKYQLHGSERIWYRDAIERALKGDLTLVDIIAGRQLPQQFPEISALLTETATISAAFYRALLTHSNLRIDLLIESMDQQIATGIIARLLTSEPMLTDLDIHMVTVYERICDRALEAGPGLLRQNLMRAALALFCLQYRDPVQRSAWRVTFRRVDVLGVRDIWTDIGRTLSQLLEHGGCERAVADVLAAMISLLDPLGFSNPYPESVTYSLVRELLDRLPTEALVHCFLSVHDNPDLDAAFNLVMQPKHISAIFDYITQHHHTCVRETMLNQISRQELGAPNDICTICLEDHRTADSVTQPDLDVSHYTYRASCGHHFHSHCIIKWFRINSCCPLCRVCVFDIDTVVSYIRRKHCSEIDFLTGHVVSK